jgi:hypothetical protein
MQRNNAIAWCYSSSRHRTFHVLPQAKNRRGGRLGIRVSNVVNHHDQEMIIMIHGRARVCTKIANVHFEHSQYSHMCRLTFILVPFEARAQCPIWPFSVFPWCCSGIFRMILRRFLPATTIIIIIIITSSSSSSSSSSNILVMINP